MGKNIVASVGNSAKSGFHLQILSRGWKVKCKWLGGGGGGNDRGWGAGATNCLGFAPGNFWHFPPV